MDVPYRSPKTDFKFEAETSSVANCFGAAQTLNVSIPNKNIIPIALVIFNSFR